MESLDHTNVWDEEAFRHIFDVNHRRVYKVCLKMGLSEEDAEDIVQDTFFQFWKQRSAVDFERNVEGLLKTIARRLVIKRYHGRRLFLSLNEDDKYLDESELAADTEQIKLLTSAVENLTDRRKEIIKYIYEDNLSAKETADKLNLSVRTVENQLFRAKRILREEIQRGMSS